MDAARTILAELGPGGFTVDEVAARAGVGKATIYRRWPSRADLLLTAVEGSEIEMDDPDSGSVRDDLVALLSSLAVNMRETTAGRMLPSMIAEAATNPDLRARLPEFMAERRVMACNVVARAIQRGELPPDTDVDLVLDMCAGPVFLRLLLTQMPVDQALVEASVDTVLRGIAATATPATPT